MDEPAGPADFDEFAAVAARRPLRVFHPDLRVEHFDPARYPHHDRSSPYFAADHWIRAAPTCYEPDADALGPIWARVVWERTDVEVQLCLDRASPLPSEVSELIAAMAALMGARPHAR